MDRIVDRLNALLGHKDLPELDRSRATWVLDQAVRWGDVDAVSPIDLMSEREAAEVLAERAAGASWIHANLVHVPDGRPLVVLAFGARVGNPEPTVNVSLERDRVVRIADASEDPAGP